MALVDTDLVNLTSAGVKTNFSDTYIAGKENADWKDVAEEIPTTLPLQKYGWLGRGAVMMQFTAEAVKQTALEHDWVISDEIFVANMVVERKALEDDQYGEIMKRARQLGGEPTRHWNELAYTALINGFSNLCYDGQDFYNADHNEGVSGNQSNVTNATLNDANLQIADASMRSLVDDKGKPHHIVPDTLVVGPQLMRRAWDLTGSTIQVTRIGDGTAGGGATAASPFANFFGGRYKLVVSPYLIGAAAYYWFLNGTKVTDKESKPIIIQSRSDVPITLETDMDIPTAMIKEEYQLTARGRYIAAYGLWQLSYGSNASS